MAIEERFLELAGARVRVLERPGDGGEIVLFVHGLTSSASTWEPQLASLPKGMRGIAYDSLGGGYTERRGARAPITRSDQRGLLMAVAAALGAERFRPVAHSMGCGAALGAAWRHPDRVTGLLLCSPATQGRRVLSPTIRAARNPFAARLLELSAPVVVPLLVRSRLRELAGGKPSEDLRRREAGHALARPRELVRGFVDIAGHGDLRSATPESDNYRSIRQPVWILRGGGDLDWMPESHEDRYRELLPSAKLIRWEDVGHSPHIEAPERFNELLADFIAETG